MSTEIQSTDNSIEVLPAQRTAAPEAVQMLMQHAEAMGAARQLAEGMCASDLVPAIYKGKPDNGAAAILYGAEIGLNPIQSLQQVFVVHGMPAIYARTMCALIKRHGYLVETVASADTAVTVRASDPRTGQVEESTWTIERARQAGYTSNKKYESDPQAMLFAKAATEVCRKIAPDVLLGISMSREELELEPQPPRQVRVTQTQRGVAGLAAAIGATPEPEPEPAKPTPAQNRTLNALFERAGLTKDDKAGRQIVAAALHPAPTTAEGTQHIIDQLDGAAMQGDDVIVDTVQAIITEHDEATA